MILSPIGIPMVMVLLITMTTGLKKTSKLSTNTVTITVTLLLLHVKFTNVLLNTKTTIEMSTVQVTDTSIVIVHMKKSFPNVQVLGNVLTLLNLPPTLWPIGIKTVTDLSIIMMDLNKLILMPSTNNVIITVTVKPKLVNYTNVSLNTKTP